VLHLKIGAAFLVVNIISATIMVFASQSFDGVGRWVSGGVALLFAVNAALVTRAAVGKRGYSGVNFASMAAIFLVLMASALFQIEAQSYRPADPQDVSLSQAKFVATCPPVANLLAKYLSEETAAGRPVTEFAMLQLNGACDEGVSAASRADGHIRSRGF